MHLPTIEGLCAENIPACPNRELTPSGKRERGERDKDGTRDAFYFFCLRSVSSPLHLPRSPRPKREGMRFPPRNFSSFRGCDESERDFNFSSHHVAPRSAFVARTITSIKMCGRLMSNKGETGKIVDLDRTRFRKIG